MSSPAESLDSLATLALESLLEASPFNATMLGIPGYDERVPDPTPEASAQFRVKVRELATAVEALDANQLSELERVTQAVLIHELRSAEEVEELREVEYATAPMFVAPHAPILQTLPKTILPNPERAELFLERLRRVPGYLDSSAEQLRAGTANGHTAAARSLTGSIGALDSYLSSNLADDLLHTPTPPEWDGKSGWEQRRTAVIRDEVRPALARLRETYVELRSSARPDDNVGVSWLPDGDHIYEVKARSNTTTSLKPQELHDLGLSVLDQLRDEYAEIGSRALGTSNADEVLERMRNDPSLRLANVNELLEISQDCLDRCNAALPDWFGILPDSGCELALIPAAEAVTSAPAYYTPPDASTGRRGTYWVNGHEIANRARYDVEAIAFHEAIPGHHLQLAIAQQMTQLPLFRRVMISTAYAEGWGLYAERLADEMGLYSSDLQRLGMLSADSWRACRLVVDSGLHAFGWSFQKAVDFMAANTPLPHSVIVPEVDRYVGMPGQALGYMVGRLEILRMRDEAKQSLGSKFDIKGFHDAVLEGGSVPLAVLDGEIGRWVSSRT